MQRRFNLGQLYISMIVFYFCFSFFSEGLLLFGRLPSKVMATYKVATIIFVLCILAFIVLRTKYIPKMDFYIFITVIVLNVLAIFVSYKRYKLIEARGIVNFCVTILNCFVFYFFIRTVPIFKTHINYSLICFYFIVLCACIFNLFVYHDDILKLFSTQYKAYDINIRGPFGNRNTFAGYLFLGIVVGNLLFKFKKKYKFHIVICNLFLLFNLLLTLSRTAILGTVIFLVILFVFTNELSRMQKIFLIFLALFGLAIVKSTSLWEFVQQKLIRKQHGNTGRTKIWTTSLQMNSNIFEILFGVGYGVKESRLMEMIRRTSEHNTYLELYNLGGVLLLGLMLIFKGKMCIKSSKLKNKEMAISLIAFQLSVLVVMFFESYSLLGSVAEKQLTFYLFASLPMLLKKLDEAMDNNTYYPEQIFQVN